MLTNLEVVALHKWMTENEIVVKSNQYERTAAIASDTLKFPISGGNIAGMAKDLGWGRRQQPLPSSKTSTQILARAILKLASELNVNMPSELQNLANP